MLINPATGKTTVDYTGRTRESVTVQGLTTVTAATNLLLDPVWLLYCSVYDCHRIVSVKTLRPMLSGKNNISGRGWESRYDKLIGFVYPGTSLTVLSHALKPRKKGAIMTHERHIECLCNISNITRWLTAHDLTSGNTKTFRLYAAMRPTGLLIDPITELFIGSNAVYEGVTNIATDGRAVTYYRISIDGLPQLLHRVVWFLHHGVYPTTAQEIHHKDHNTADNRIKNLELLDRKGIRNNSQSLHKMRSVRGVPVTSQYKGVSWNKQKNKWCASITVGGRSKYIGYYTTERAAASAYDKHALHLNTSKECIYTLNSELHLLF
jgi:hypothetical protein